MITLESFGEKKVFLGFFLFLAFIPLDVFASKKK